MLTNQKISPPKGNRRKQVKRACSNCRAAHAGCDNQRPCSRCISKSLTDSCQEWTEEETRKSEATHDTLNTNSLPQKRSREQIICNHGWDSGDPSLLSELISHDFSYQEFPFFPNQPSYQPIQRQEDSVILKTSEPEEIYTHVCLPHEECHLCSDCQENQKRQNIGLSPMNLNAREFGSSPLDSSAENIVSPEISKIPTLPEYLPHHKIETSSLKDTAMQRNHATTWYQFTESKVQKATSVWLIKKQGRSDDWTILECNQAFIDLIQKLPYTISSSYSMMDLVPQRFRASTSELLQQIINSNVNNASAKSLWKKGESETCVSSVFQIFQSSDNERNATAEINSFQSKSKQFDHPMPDQIQNWNEYPSAKCSCEKTGCGAYRTDWQQQKEENIREQEQQQQSVCVDLASISNSMRESDRIVIAEHEEVDFYDDFIRIGDKTHEQTFSIQVSTIIALASNSSMSIKPKSRRLKSTN